RCSSSQRVRCLRHRVYRRRRRGRRARTIAVKTAPATETSAMSVIREGFYRIGETDARPVAVSELQAILRSVRRSVNCAFLVRVEVRLELGCVHDAIGL